MTNYGPYIKPNFFDDESSKEQIRATLYCDIFGFSVFGLVFLFAVLFFLSAMGAIGYFAYKIFISF